MTVWYEEGPFYQDTTTQQHVTLTTKGFTCNKRWTRLNFTNTNYGIKAVAENSKGYTTHQIKAAKEARRTQGMMGNHMDGDATGCIQIKLPTADTGTRIDNDNQGKAKWRGEGTSIRRQEDTPGLWFVMAPSTYLLIRVGIRNFKWVLEFQEKCMKFQKWAWSFKKFSTF